MINQNQKIMRFTICLFSKVMSSESKITKSRLFRSQQSHPHYPRWEFLKVFETAFHFLGVTSHYNSFIRFQPIRFCVFEFVWFRAHQSFSSKFFQKLRKFLACFYFYVALGVSSQILFHSILEVPNEA